MKKQYYWIILFLFLGICAPSSAQTIRNEVLEKPDSKPRSAAFTSGPSNERSRHRSLNLSRQLRKIRDRRIERKYRNGEVSEQVYQLYLKTGAVYTVPLCKKDKKAQSPSENGQDRSEKTTEHRQTE